MSEPAAVASSPAVAPAPAAADAGRGVHLAGLAYTTGAYAVWGLAPLYWKAVGAVPPGELVAYRVVSCCVLMLALVAACGRFALLRRVLATRRAMVSLLASTALIGVNWFLFIYAIASDQVLQASLGYYVNPLLTVALGMAVLGERMRPAQWTSVALAAAGVTVVTLSVGRLPWLALALAVSFALYSLLRKTVAAAPEEALLVETAILAPLVAVYLAHLATTGRLALPAAGPGETVLVLLGTGAITAVPLVWFAHGARRLPLSTVGILQYLAPTGQLLLAVLVFGEPFARPQQTAFLLIWAALAVFTVDLWRRDLRRPR